MGSITCPQCGAVNPAGARFCRGCGLNLTQRLRQSGVLQPPGSSTTGGAPPPTQPSGGPPTVVQGPGQPGVPPQQVVAQALAGQIGNTPLAPGGTLQSGRYVVDRALGAGGMGSVFLAHDTHVNNKPVVIKEMANVYATEQERREAEAEFQAEMATLAALSHPNIPQISDFFTESNRHFAVQEYVGGQDLQKAIEAAQAPNQPPQGLPEKQVLSWMSQVLAVLEYLEAQTPQVIHRDIKPGNIIVDANNRVRVVDFGIASHKFKPGSTRAMASQVSTALGTPGYAPKEQFTGQETTLSDIYALGATMHHLLTGRDPTKVQPLWQYPPVRALSPKVSEASDHIVARALQNEPKKRYQNATEMKRDVDRVLNPPGALSTVKGKAVAVLIVLLLLAVAGGGSLLYARQQALLPATGSVSDGGIAFDVQAAGHTLTATDPRAWAAVKQKAAIDYKNGNRDHAASEYADATTNDQTDAESWIYQQNMQVAGNAPYYIGVGGSFSGVNASTGRQILQGVYTAQKEINDRGGINGHPIALVLANDASTDDGARQSADKVDSQHNVLAVVGYRSSTRTGLAIPILAAKHISLVSPTASNPNLSDPYFFRVCPDDNYQGTQAALYMMGSLLKGKPNPAIAVLKDPGDRYSNTLGGIVSAVAESRGARILSDTFTSGQTTDFSAQARRAISGHADLVYFAGLARDALMFARALDAAGAPPTLRIMSDDGFYNPAEFVAQPGHKGRFHFTGFFYPDEDGLVTTGAARRVIQTMKALYLTNFHRAGVHFGEYGSDRVPAGAALSYDALKVIATALKASGPTPTREKVRDAIAAIGNAAPAYQGATGRVAFDSSGNPVDKALLVMHLDSYGHTKLDQFLGTFR